MEAKNILMMDLFLLKVKNKPTFKLNRNMKNPKTNKNEKST